MGEFGRTPVVEMPKKGSNEGRINGRDHNHWGFTVWMAGGGIKGGTVYGETDDFGHKAVQNVVKHTDYHATLLHLFGLDPKRLTILRNGREQSLLDNQEGRVVTDILKHG